MSPTRAAGLVIFRNINQVIEFLMLQTSYGQHHWTPPKGHVDPGESDWITALRETKEEAGLSENELEVRIILSKQYSRVRSPPRTYLSSEKQKVYKDISKELHYEVKTKPKIVVYWLAKLKDPEIKVTLSDEHQDLKWLPLEEAQEISGYDDMKNLLSEFHEKAKSKLVV